MEVVNKKKTKQRPKRAFFLAMTREEKYAYYYEQNKQQGIKNALGQIMEPRLCSECDSVLGAEVFKMIHRDGEDICENCTSSSPPLLMDYTEKALYYGMPSGHFRDRCIQRHRKEAAENQRSLGKTIKKSDN